MSGPSPTVHLAASRREAYLMDMPNDWLHSLVFCLDGRARRQLFLSSRGSQHSKGCAVLVLRACKVTVCRMLSKDIKPGTEAASSTLVMAATLSPAMSLVIHAAGHDPVDIFASLAGGEQGQDARQHFVCPSITSLEIRNYKSPSLIPAILSKVLPNLTSLQCVEWQIQPPPSDVEEAPVASEGLSGIQYLQVTNNCGPVGTVWTPTVQHIVRQLQHLPAVTSLAINDHTLDSLPAALLARLTQLQLVCQSCPSFASYRAVAACKRLNRLGIWGQNAVSAWVTNLHMYTPQLQALDVHNMELTDHQVPALLCLKANTALTCESLHTLCSDYAREPCAWKHVRFTRSGSNHIAKLPLHALEHPVECTEFWIRSSADHAGDMAAIRAAKPHLERCGGVRMKDALLVLTAKANPVLLPEEAADLLTAWAPHLSKPTKIIVYGHNNSINLYRAALEELWPGVEVVVVER